MSKFDSEFYRTIIEAARRNRHHNCFELVELLVRTCDEFRYVDSSRGDLLVCTFRNMDLLAKWQDEVIITDTRIPFLNRPSLDGSVEVTVRLKDVFKYYEYWLASVPKK